MNNEEDGKYQDEFGAFDRAHFRDPCDDVFERELGGTAESKFLLNVCHLINKVKALYNEKQLPTIDQAMLELPDAYDSIISTDHVLSVSNIDALSWVFGWIMQVGKPSLSATDVQQAIQTLNAKWFDTPIDPYGILRMARYWITLRDPQQVPVYFEAS
jgi:hypothetical protein